MNINNLINEWGFDEEVKFESLMPKVTEKIGEVGIELKVPDFQGLLNTEETNSGSTSDEVDEMQE